MLLDYLKETYGEGKPIFVSKIEFNGMSRNAIRLQLMRLVKEGKLKRYGAGIYYFPVKSIFGLDAPPSFDEILGQKYFFDNGKRIGYLSGILLANLLGLTTQVPARRTVVSNRATTEYRLVHIGTRDIILRKPRVPVNDQNYLHLSILDLVQDMDMYAEVGYSKAKQILMGYMDRCGIPLKDLLPFLPYYPARTYRNLFKLGMLDDIAP